MDLNPRSIGTVARWEFFRTIKSPTFIVLTIVVPLVMLLSGGLSFVTHRVAESEAFELALIDELGDFHPLVEMEMESSLVPSGLAISSFPGTIEEAEVAVRAGELDGLAVLNSSVITSGSLTIITAARGEARAALANGVFSRAISAYRLRELGLSSEEIASSVAPVSIEARSIDREDGDGWIGDVMVPTIVAMVLIFSAVFSGQIMMYGVIKEKRNRIVEILLSSVSSMDLLVGKLIGFGALGILQIFLWVGVGLLTAGRFFDLTGLSPTATDGATYLAYFVLGYLLLASMFAAMGAMMKDAEGGGQVQGLVILVPMIPVFLAGPLLASPNALWARIMSHVPPFIPSAVLLRMAGTDLPAWEVASTLLLLALSVWGFISLSAKIFEGGILRFERATTFREALRMAARKPGR